MGFPDTERAWTLAEVAGWPIGENRLAVLGFPVTHSLSPRMHNAALKQLALTDPKWADWRYYKVEVQPEELAEALPLLSAKGFVGLNLTLPHKVDAVDLIGQIDPVASRMGAVNTLRRMPGGRWSGRNTDGLGMERAILHGLDRGLRESEVVLLGAGGAARAAAVQCLEAGCRHLYIGNRNTERLAGLVSRLGAEASDRVTPFSLPGFPEAAPEGCLLIHATSLGLKVDDPLVSDPVEWPEDSALFDMVYGTGETRLVEAARSRGLNAVSGLGMLVWQGALALEGWTGVGVPVDVMRAAAEARS